MIVSVTQGARALGPWGSWGRFVGQQWLIGHAVGAHVQVGRVEHRRLEVLSSCPVTSTLTCVQ